MKLFKVYSITLLIGFVNLHAQVPVCTWVSGSDNNGNLWLFGGSGFPASGGPGYLNDLWRYNISTNEWT